MFPAVRGERPVARRTRAGHPRGALSRQEASLQSEAPVVAPPAKRSAAVFAFRRRHRMAAASPGARSAPGRPRPTECSLATTERTPAVSYVSRASPKSAMLVFRAPAAAAPAERVTADQVTAAIACRRTARHALLWPDSRPVVSPVIVDVRYFTFRARVSRCAHA